MLKPRPVPFPGCFDVKNGSNTLSRIAAGMPVPVSLTANQGIAAGSNFTVHACVIFVENNRPGLEDKLAAVGHRIAGVDREIEKCCRKLVGIDRGQTCFIFKYRFDLDLLAEGRSQQFCGFDDEGVEVGVPRLQRLLAGERKKMLGEIRASRGGFIDHLRDGREVRLLRDGVGQNFDRFL